MKSEDWYTVGCLNETNTAGRRVCAWHVINWGRELDLGPAETEQDTHSICASCMQVMIENSNLRIEV